MCKLLKESRVASPLPSRKHHSLYLPLSLSPSLSMAAAAADLYSFRSFCRISSPKTPHLPPPLLFRSTSFSHKLPSFSAKPNHTKRWRCSPLTPVSSLGKLSESELVPIPTETEEIVGKFPSDSGVYAVYDKNTELQFIGISRNIAASLMGHFKTVPSLCCSVKIGIVEEPDRAALTAAWKSWMEEQIGSTGKVPPGNETGNNTWVRRRQQKSDLRLTPGRHVQLTVPLEELIDRLVKENHVVVFIKGSRNAPQCGFSQRVVGILDQKGIDYESVDILDEEFNGDVRETLKRYSNWPTFPQVFVKGELIGGADILSSMAEKGEIARVFNK